jgi:hypothetical protein
MWLQYTSPKKHKILFECFWNSLAIFLMLIVVSCFIITCFKFFKKIPRKFHMMIKVVLSTTPHTSPWCILNKKLLKHAQKLMCLAVTFETWWIMFHVSNQYFKTCKAFFLGMIYKTYHVFICLEICQRNTYLFSTYF